MRAIALAALLAALCLAAAAPAAEPVYVNWPALLPGLPSGAGGTGGPQPGCEVASLKCVDRQIRRMRRTQRRLGCDHRAVFDTTYLELTRELRRTVVADPGFFADLDAFYYEDALFAEIYFRALKADETGGPVDAAWRIAFDAARSGDLTATGDMLLGINAHVQNDMPFVLAALTLRDASGRSRKPDHDRANDVLDRAFERVVQQVAARFDPITALQTYQLSPASDYLGIEMVKLWREGVWRNAERLAFARTDAERRAVADSIELQAAVSAELIRAATLGPPGHRARRDAYCAERQRRL